jgi:serine/threonine protein kinase
LATRIGGFEGQLGQLDRQLQGQGKALSYAQKKTLCSAGTMLENAQGFVAKFQHEANSTLADKARKVWSADDDDKAFTDFNMAINQYAVDLTLSLVIDAAVQQAEDAKDAAADRKAMREVLEAGRELREQHGSVMDALKELRAAQAGDRAFQRKDGGAAGKAASAAAAKGLGHLPRLIDSYDYHPNEDPELLGKGAFGEVLCVRARGGGRELCAVKCLQVRHAEDAHLDIIVYEQESKLLRAVHHVNIVAFYGNFVDGAGTRRNPLLFCLLMELVTGGSLADYVEKGEGQPTEVLSKWALQLCDALYHMHVVCRMLHRDLKPGNVLLTGPSGDVKICDFGLACVARSRNSMTGNKGTSIYSSKEKVDGGDYGGQNNTADDMWALGCLLFEITTMQKTESLSPAGLWAVPDKVALQVVAAVRATKHPRFADAVARLLALEAAERPSAKQVRELLDGSEEQKAAAQKTEAQLRAQLAELQQELQRELQRQVKPATSPKLPAAVPEAQWEKMDECCLCHTDFGMFTRRHHCRQCGRSVCDDCSPRTVQMCGGGAAKQQPQQQRQHQQHQPPARALQTPARFALLQEKVSEGAISADEHEELLRRDRHGSALESEIGAAERGGGVGSAQRTCVECEDATVSFLAAGEHCCLEARNIGKYFVGMRLEDFGPMRVTGTVTSISPHGYEPSGPGSVEVTHDAPVVLPASSTEGNSFATRRESGNERFAALLRHDGLEVEKRSAKKPSVVQQRLLKLEGDHAFAAPGALSAMRLLCGHKTVLVSQITEYDVLADGATSTAGAGAAAAARDNNEWLAISFSGSRGAAGDGRIATLTVRLPTVAFHLAMIELLRAEEIAVRQRVLEFTSEALSAATNNYDADQLLVEEVVEEAGCSVFRGHLPLHGDIALKRLKRLTDSSEASLRTEATVLGKYRHANIVTLIGRCFEDGPPRENMLVFEMMELGALSTCLLDSMVHRAPLTMAERLSIASDVGRALVFLHSHADLPIVHQNVRTSNILLAIRGDRIIAKLGGFGTVREAGGLLDEGVTHIQTKTWSGPVGSKPYMSHECLQGRISFKTDAYAFGIVLLELMTGMPAVDSTTTLGAKTRFGFQPNEEWSAENPSSAKTLGTLMFPKFGRPDDLVPMMDTKAQWERSHFLKVADISRSCLVQSHTVRSHVRDVLPRLDNLAKQTGKLTLTELLPEWTGEIVKKAKPKPKKKK